MLMEDFLREHPQPDSATMISINAHGFRGPEITLPKPPSRFRIMTIGDSCTWGLGVSDDCSYPRVLEQELNRQVAADCGLTVEVVNGGFCAYGFERALLRVGEYLATEPDLITIYLGWNRTIFRADPRRSPQLYHKYALYRFFYHALINRSQGGSRWLDERGEYYDPADESLEPFRHHCFEHDLRDLDRLVTAIRDHDSRIRILLVTLAGMLDRAVEPDAAALAMVGPLEISDNLYLYPLLTARFNQALRQYARRRDLPVLDLERHARGHFIPRSAYFLDPVHPSAAGYAAIGRFMASELLGYLPCH
jgi:lysophospholipase L1-like esterase